MRSSKSPFPMLIYPKSHRLQRVVRLTYEVSTGWSRRAIEVASRRWALGISVAGTSSLAACQRQWASCRLSKKYLSHVLASMGVSTARDPQGWRSLAMPRRELCLAFTLPTGQSFRWRKTDDDMYTGVVHQRVVGFSAT